MSAPSAPPPRRRSTWNIPDAPTRRAPPRRAGTAMWQPGARHPRGVPRGTLRMRPLVATSIDHHESRRSAPRTCASVPRGTLVTSWDWAPPRCNVPRVASLVTPSPSWNTAGKALPRWSVAGCRPRPLGGPQRTATIPRPWWRTVAQWHTATEHAERCLRAGPRAVRSTRSSSPGSAAPAMDPRHGAGGSSLVDAVRPRGQLAKSASYGYHLNPTEAGLVASPSRPGASRRFLFRCWSHVSPRRDGAGTFRCHPSWSYDHQRSAALPPQRRPAETGWRAALTPRDPGGPGRVASGRRGKPRIVAGSPSEAPRAPPTSDDVLVTSRSRGERYNPRGTLP